MRSWALLLVGIVVGALAVLTGPRFYRPQTLAQCLIENMKGQPGPMFATVYDYCQTNSKAEMSDKDVGLDDWKPVGKFGANDNAVK